MNENAFASPLPPPSSSSPSVSPSPASGAPSASNPPTSNLDAADSFAVADTEPEAVVEGKEKEKPLNTRIADIIEKIISHIPETNEPVSNTPDARARHIVSRAATTAGLVSGGLAIPPGPFAFATLIPDLYAIWKIQSQMIADIAAAYGKKAELRREHMLYCLFRHITSQVARDIAVRVGQRILIRPGSIAIMNRIFRIVGAEITQRIAARTATAWVPLFGAAAVGGYAWYDTRTVGYTAIALFSPDLKGEPAPVPQPLPSSSAAVILPAMTPAPATDSEVLDFDGFVDLPPLPPSPDLPEEIAK